MKTKVHVIIHSPSKKLSSFWKEVDLAQKTLALYFSIPFQGQPQQFRQQIPVARQPQHQLIRPPAPKRFQGQQPLWDLIQPAPPQSKGQQQQVQVQEQSLVYQQVVNQRRQQVQEQKQLQQTLPHQVQ